MDRVTRHQQLSIERENTGEYGQAKAPRTGPWAPKYTTGRSPMPSAEIAANLRFYVTDTFAVIPSGPGWVNLAEIAE